MAGEPGIRVDAALADCHVHIHRCFELDAFLDSALANFRRAAVELGIWPAPHGALLLSETGGEHAFDRLLKLTPKSSDRAWTFRPTSEATSLIACKGDEDRLILVAGRQIATREGLEVLALNSNQEHPDGSDFQGTLDAVLASGCLAVVPWGFGKWWFRRRAILRHVLRTRRDPGLFLGDNAGRLGLGPTPRLFAEARSVGVRVLPGSDPLPFRSQVAKIARYGCLVGGPLELDRPGASLVHALATSESHPRIYGRLERVGTFCLHQALMQARKRCGALNG